MKKRRVKIFIDGEVLILKHFSGIGHYTADLLRAVDKLLFQDEYSHFSIEIGVPYRHKHDLAKYEFQNLAIRGMPFPGRITNGLKQKKRLPPIDLLFGKKVYLFPNYSSWPTMYGLNIPIIYDLSFVNHAHFVEPRNQAFLVEQVQLSVQRAKKILTISNNSKQEIVQHYRYSAHDIEIAHPAVDMHKFYRRSSNEISVTKAKYGIFGEYILFVGNIEPRKNLITLLKAYKELSPKLQAKYSLLLIGAKGWLDNEITNMVINMRVEGLRVIQPTDYVVDEDLPALYSGASVFAYISQYEGFGIPPIESMACGTPVISSNNSSLPEAVGSAAIQIDALDVPALTSSLATVLTDKKIADQLIESGYEQIMKFEWAESAKVLLRMAEEIYK
jgi:glycosyltransferase involved in cell wall biosynthesis